MKQETGIKFLEKSILCKKFSTKYPIKYDGRKTGCEAISNSPEPMLPVTSLVLLIVRHIVKISMTTNSCKKTCKKYKENLHSVLLIFSTYNVFST